jgi:hypothetical protein
MFPRLPGLMWILRGPPGRTHPTDGAMTWCLLHIAGQTRAVMVEAQDKAAFGMVFDPRK